MRNHARVGLTASLVWLGMSGACACGSTTTSGGGPAGGDAGSASVQEFVKAYCDAARACCQKAGFPLDPLAQCETNFTNQVDVFAFVEKGTVLINSAAVATCVGAFRTAASSCNGSDQRNPACQEMFTGTIAPEAACEKSDECAGDPVVCLKTLAPGVTSTPATGICKPAARGKAGDPCFLNCSPGRSCSTTYSTDNPAPPLTLCYEEDGLFCSRTGADARCAPLASVGGPCTTYESCGSNRFCTSASVCIERKAAGAACVEIGECGVGLTCVNGVCGPLPFENQKTCRGDFN